MRLQMPEQRLDITHSQVVPQRMVEHRLQRVEVLLFRHGAASGDVQTLWMAASPGVALQLGSANARQLFTSAQFQRTHHAEPIAQAHWVP